MATLRPIVPRASLHHHTLQLRRRLLPHPKTSAPALTVRSASTSTTPPPKPRILAKPERFNPPSHGSRLPRSKRSNIYPGAPLTPEQRTRRYPHMFPSEGTWTFWFLTNRLLHAGITLTILVSLVIAVQVVDFVHNTPFGELLPPRSMALGHPLSFLGRYWEVYRMHVDWVSQQTAERRRQKVEDVRKRSEYRKAHGMEEEGILGGWTARRDEEVMGPGMREGGEVAAMGARGSDLSVQGGGDVSTVGEESTYVDFDGNRQPLRKKWFGIW